ncbi:DUF4440 domain-containing protein [Streptomyces tropicalis]|uniref:DUF4440 domain-containing protein n=1 Tax=Streptomyces tropicalis TaxID=3034234 RepID=A0ABT6A9S4_9ACTN|nr:DUF4440 domain-containing protein [Streptomyces tropicalis]MDF3301407.1 DUF4440 domain-containing protein [Streptomyces tropicalis]
MTVEDEQAVQAAVDGELRLLDPGVRASAARVQELLEPEFVEFGASGRRRDAGSVLDVTGSGDVSAEPPVEVTRMSGTVLAPGVVHLVHFSGHRGRKAWRSSLWRLTGTGRRMYFHQATPTD